MADNQGNLTDTSDEISISYRMMNLPNEEDENDECIAEYLDLDLENASVQETEEYCRQVTPAMPLKTRPQSSVLKKNCTGTTRGKRNVKSKSVKSTVDPPKRSTVRTRSLTSNDNNLTKRTTKRKAPINLESSNVHTAVDEINAKLAISANLANDRISNDIILGQNVKPDSSINSEISTKPRRKTDLDSLDLFFQSMAQTVMTLPTTVQARIKMDICRVIAMTEMKYAAHITTEELDKH